MMLVCGGGGYCRVGLMYAAFSAVCFLFVFVLTQHKSIFEVSIVNVCVRVVVVVWRFGCFCLCARVFSGMPCVQ